MKKISTYIITVVISIFIGFAGMYVFVYYFPNTFIETVNRIEKDVTVTDEGISAGIENIYDATLTVQNYKKNKLAGIGSGFIYDEKGYIMTNHHVIEGASEIKVLLSNGETLTAELIGSDEYADLAVLKIDEKKVLKVAKIGSGETLKVGDTVFAIGTPVGVTYAGTVTRGILSGKDRMVEVAIGDSQISNWVMNVMQTDAAINPGNSGGPLCNVNGEVVGINSIKIVETTVEGVGFSIPIEDALEYADRIINGEEIKRSYLGIEMADMSYSSYYFIREGIDIDSSITSGVVVMNILEDGPAGEAGIKKGDVITMVEKDQISNIAHLRYYLYSHEPGKNVKITVMRGKETKEFIVKLGKSK